jgi:hypothetical protein
MTQRVLEMKMVMGPSAEELAFILQVPIIPTTKQLPFKLHQQQLPMSICY